MSEIGKQPEQFFTLRLPHHSTSPMPIKKYVHMVWRDLEVTFLPARTPNLIIILYFIFCINVMLCRDCVDTYLRSQHNTSQPPFQMWSGRSTYILIKSHWHLTKTCIYPYLADMSRYRLRFTAITGENGLIVDPVEHLIWYILFPALVEFLWTTSM